VNEAEVWVLIALLAVALAAIVALVLALIRAEFRLLRAEIRFTIHSFDGARERIEP
jgi:hypothetical protein